MKRDKIKIKAEFPFNPAKIPFFYGWVVLIAGSIGIIFSTPGQSIGVSVFTENLIDSLHLTRNQLTTAYMFGTICSSFLLTNMGRMYDKMGARVIIIGASVLLGFVLIYLTFVDNLANIVKSTFNIDGIWPVMVLITIGFFGIRFLGQGTLTMISRNMVMKWFDKKRGAANMILGAVVALGFSAAPKVFDSLINSYGWENAWIVMGLFIAIAFGAFALIFFRDNPQDSGLVPDGKLINKIVKSETSADIKQFTMKEARRTKLFWIYNFVLALNGFIITAFTFLIESIFKEAGYDRATAISVFVPSAIIAVCTSLVLNFVSDYLKLKNILFINAFAIILVCIGNIGLTGSFKMYTLIIIGMGLMNGSFSVVSALAWPRFFGIKYLGEVSGYALSFMVFATAVAPFLFSMILSMFNSYNIAFYLCLVICCILFFLSLGTKSENENHLKI